MLEGEDRNLFYKYINQLMRRKVYMYEILALESENSGANLLIKQIVDDIAKSGLVKLEVEE